MPSTLCQATLMNLAERIGPTVLRAWIRSLRVTVEAADESFLPEKRNGTGVIYAGWHETLLAPATLYGRLRPYSLVSKSRDGEYIARIVTRLGWQVIRGSSHGSALSATWDVMDALRLHETRHFFLATDGPRGPRRVFKEGAIYLASRLQRPLVLIGVAHDCPWRAGSWDRFVVPRPFSRVCIAFSSAIDIPRNVNRRSIQEILKHVQRTMNEVQHHAEELLAEQPAPHSTSTADFRCESGLRITAGYPLAPLSTSANTWSINAPSVQCDLAARRA